MNIIELRNITKQYPGKIKKANDNITLELRKGEILCIAGENGAGKTTLMKILCGYEKQYSGTVIIKNNVQIGMVHQHFMLFPEYTASENIVMGVEPLKWGIFFDSKKAREISGKIINDLDFSIKPDNPVKELTLGQMQQVEICRVLHRNADVIVLDEPTSILTEHEINSLFKTLKTLVLNGKSIILITHKINEIIRISDRVAVLRKGELAGVRDIKNTDVNEIARMMIGNDKPEFEILEKNESKNKDNIPVIAFENVTVRRKAQKRPLLDNVSFSVNKGEILGFAGVGGNGLGVVEAVLGGFLHPASGKILHNGKDISRFSQRELRKNGLAYVPADRTKIGSAQEATIEENMIIIDRNEYKNMNSLELLLSKYNIDIPGIKEKASSLSGGNLQKLILAREINCLKDYIVFSEPAWGLDIASSQFIIKEIDALRKKAAAIILISTNLDEILALSDRIIVMYRGKIAGEYANNGEAIKEHIGNSMQGTRFHMTEKTEKGINNK
ncbi:MAG: ATP-binding cassette domain-containing protein [Treponema sp.]|nr:ATP-binding cassette domain-containing protein [Treponema sp.]